MKQSWGAWTEGEAARTDYHAFVDGDVGRCGAILRRVDERSLRTRTVFRMGDDAPVYLVDPVLDHDGDVRRWRRFTYDSPTSQSHHTGMRDAAGAATQEAELRRHGLEETELLDGSTVEAARFQLVVAGRPTNTHWCVDGRVLKSDWCGAQSFLVDDVDDLCAGLDREVAARIREFAERRSGDVAAGAS